jgi:hypothetical protein
MKTQAFKLTIENPCHENWNQMKVNGQGRYCSSCAKTVVDFSGMSADEIGNYFKILYTESKASGKAINVCGHVKKSQLAASYSFTYKTPYQFNSTVVRLSLAGILTLASLHSFSQTKKGRIKLHADEKVCATQNNLITKDNSGKANNTPTTKAGKPVKFQVKVVSEGKAMANATVQFAGIAKKYKSDKAGMVYVSLPDSLAEKTLTMSVGAPGMESQSMQVDLKTQNATVIKVNLYYMDVMVNGGLGFVPLHEPKNQQP